MIRFCGREMISWLQSLVVTFQCNLIGSLCLVHSHLISLVNICDLVTMVMKIVSYLNIKVTNNPERSNDDEYQTINTTIAVQKKRWDWKKKKTEQQFPLYIYYELGFWLVGFIYSCVGNLLHSRGHIYIYMIPVVERRHPGRINSTEIYTDPGVEWIIYIYI